MSKQKVGISVGNTFAINPIDIIKIIKQAGFTAISPEWNYFEKLGEVINFARENGLTVQSLHAPFQKSDAMWSNNKEISSPAVAEILKSVADCHKYSIPVLVVHTWIGFDYTFSEESLCFENFDKIVTAAQNYGVKIAFENAEGEEFLYALLNRYKHNEYVGFCWDSGHEMCYNRSADLLKTYGSRLFMTHLNDNLGISDTDGKTDWTDDLHLLPFDGIADWDYNIKRLKESKPLDFLNFELTTKSKPGRHENDVYAQMPLEQYFAAAYERACKIADKYFNK